MEEKSYHKTEKYVNQISSGPDRVDALVKLCAWNKGESKLLTSLVEA